MLDFKKLEKELDEALAKETPESLKTWLKKKRETSIAINVERDESQFIDEYIDIEKLIVTAGSYVNDTNGTIEAIASLDVNVGYGDCFIPPLGNNLPQTTDSWHQKFWPPNQIPKLFKKTTPRYSGSFFFTNVV